MSRLRRRLAFSVCLVTLGLAAGCAGPAARSAPPPVVARVDLSRYVGTWYEIARFPFRLQEGCYGTVATYALRSDGGVSVVNQCRKGDFGGELAIARGTARVVDPETNAKLRVSFFWPFSGDYWIVDLGASYDYAVVSGPDREYLWVLSRTPTMPEERYDEIVRRITELGFDASRLVRTPQRTP